ncbi:hypothetical protein [Pseudomonas germanica]|uniref:Uncharacterized protein n=1 Tax=Pseudomonas germanica TaxID=2815720 RepID=A0ABX8YVI3_9PSED|nr:hypothetical protein [Pseudomonas germanica]QYY84006.1 hypothetical protein J0G10_11370 [Pseudomonas germanica]
MTIDKTKLQKLLWAEAASYRTDCADWKRNTEALQEFLGEKTVEEVALELLAENERLQSAARTLGHLRYTDNGAELWKPPLGEKPDFSLIDQLKTENEALREEVALDDKIIADRDRFLNMFECPEHGQCIPYAMEQVEALRKDAERLRNAADFVQKLCDSAGKQPSVATGYLHDILSTMGKDGRS